MFFPLSSGVNAAPVSVQAHCQCSVITVQALMLAVVALKQPAIECLTICLSCVMLPSEFVTLGTFRPKDSRAMF